MSLVRNINNIQRIRCAYSSISLSRFSTSSTPVPTNPDTPKTTPSNTDPTGLGSNRATYKPDNWEKKFLVCTGKFKSVEEVPEYIKYMHTGTMERTRNKLRIKGANIMMALTVVGCIVMIYSGKKAAKEGQSVEKYNLDWHKSYNEANAKPTSK